MKIKYLDHNTDDALDAHDKNGFRTFFRRITGSVADSVLRLDAEQKAGCKTVHIVDTRFPSRSFLIS